MAIDRALTVSVLKTSRREHISGNFEGNFKSEPPLNPPRRPQLHRRSRACERVSGDDMSVVMSLRIVSAVIIADITCFQYFRRTALAVTDLTISSTLP